MIEGLVLRRRAVTSAALTFVATIALPGCHATKPVIVRPRRTVHVAVSCSEP
jgi:hypothetical protein